MSAFGIFSYIREALTSLESLKRTSPSRLFLPTNDAADSRIGRLVLFYLNPEYREQLDVIRTVVATIYTTKDPRKFISEPGDLSKEHIQNSIESTLLGYHFNRFQQKPPFSYKNYFTDKPEIFRLAMYPPPGFSYHKQYFDDHTNKLMREWESNSRNSDYKPVTTSDATDRLRDKFFLGLLAKQADIFFLILCMQPKSAENFEVIANLASRFISDVAQYLIWSTSTEEHSQVHLLHLERTTANFMRIFLTNILENPITRKENLLQRGYNLALLTVSKQEIVNKQDKSSMKYHNTCVLFLWFLSAYFKGEHIEENSWKKAMRSIHEDHSIVSKLFPEGGIDFLSFKALVEECGDISYVPAWSMAKLWFLQTFLPSKFLQLQTLLEFLQSEADYRRSIDKMLTLIKEGRGLTIQDIAYIKAYKRTKVTTSRQSYRRSSHLLDLFSDEESWRDFSCLFLPTCDLRISFLFFYTLCQYANAENRFAYWEILQKEMFSEIEKPDSDSATKKKNWEVWLQRANCELKNCIFLEKFMMLALEIVTRCLRLKTVPNPDFLHKVGITNVSVQQGDYPSKFCPKNPPPWKTNLEILKSFEEKKSPIQGLLGVWRREYQRKDREYKKKQMSAQ